jgi:hypothetical protein
MPVDRSVYRAVGLHCDLTGTGEMKKNLTDEYQLEFFAGAICRSRDNRTDVADD